MALTGLSSDLMLPQVNTTVAEPWTNTQINVVKLSYLWTIINYSFLPEHNGGTVLSPTFSDGEDENTWQLGLYPYDRSRWDDVRYLSISLNLKSSQNSKVRAMIKLSILNATNEKIYNLYETIYTISDLNSPIKYEHLVKRDYLHDDKNKLLLNDELRILCEISATSDIVVTSGPKDTTTFDVTERQLPEDLHYLFESKKFSDVTLVSNGTEFQAHKSILAARSPVFSETFENDVSSRLELPATALKEGVFREILRFIYTDKVNNLNELADELIWHANEYDLEKLKIMCEETLFKNLSIENSADIFIIADTSNADQLKAKVRDFIIRHAKDVMNSKSFATMMSSHPMLGAQILREILISAKK